MQFMAFSERQGHRTPTASANRRDRPTAARRARTAAQPGIRSANNFCPRPFAPASNRPSVNWEGGCRYRLRRFLRQVIDQISALPKDDNPAQLARDPRLGPWQGTMVRAWETEDIRRQLGLRLPHLEQTSRAPIE